MYCAYCSHTIVSTFTCTCSCTYHCLYIIQYQHTFTNTSSISWCMQGINKTSSTSYHNYCRYKHATVFTSFFTTVCTIASWHLIHSCHVGCLDWTWTRSVKIGLPYMTVKTSKQVAAMIMWTVHWNSLELNHYTPPLLLRSQRIKTLYGLYKSATISF